MNIDNVIEEVYKLSEKVEKVKQRIATLKGREVEIQKKTYKDYGVTTTPELIEIQRKLRKGIKRDEQEIIDMYEEIKEGFE